MTVAVVSADDPTDELRELLDWACGNEVISSHDRLVLTALVEEAGAVDVERTRRGNGGLTSIAVSTRVARTFAVSEVTIRRRAARSIRALAAAIDRFVK